MACLEDTAQHMSEECPVWVGQCRDTSSLREDLMSAKEAAEHVRDATSAHTGDA